jgi:hypothetical protein
MSLLDNNFKAYGPQISEKYVPVSHKKQRFTCIWGGAIKSWKRLD